MLATYSMNRIMLRVRRLSSLGICLFAMCGAAADQPRPDTGQPAAPAATAPADAGDLRRRMEDVDRRLESIKDLRARFTQEQHRAILKEPLVSGGTLVVKGNAVLWETLKPRPSTQSMREGEFRLYYPQRKLVEVYNVAGDLREMTGTPLPRLATLDRLFSFAPMDKDGLKQLSVLDQSRYLAVDMTPRVKSISDHVARVRVVIDTTIPCMSQMQIEDPEGEVLHISISDVKINTGVKDDEVELRTPPGVAEVHPGSAEKPPVKKETR